MFFLLKKNNLLSFIGENSYPLRINDLKETIEVSNDDELVSFVYAKVIEYSKMENFNLKDYLDYLNIQIPIDKRTEQLFELYYFNLTNPFDYNSIPYLLYQVIVTINSLKDNG